MVVLETPLVTVVHKDENLNLVHFCDIQEWYSLEDDIVVEFIMDKKVKGSTFDWIGLFREDWITFESFVTFQQGLGAVTNPETPRKRRVKFHYSRQLIDCVMLEFKYQFVYVSKYLDILGMSSLFSFTYPLKKNYSKDANIFPPSKTMTLAEELLISENSYDRKNYVSTCRFHRNPMMKNVITTCTHCRPCGHDYYSVKEKAELCYYECLRLGERVTDLECEVASHSLKLKETNSVKFNSSYTNSNTSTLKNSPNSGINLDTEKDHNAISNPSVIIMRSDSLISDLTDEKSSASDILRCEVNHLNLPSCQRLDIKSGLSQEDKSVEDYSGLLNKDQVKLRNSSAKNEISIRSTSYPPDNATSNNSSVIHTKSKDVRKCVSDSKLNSSEAASLADVDSPLILKAIIGHQEERIRRLTQLLHKQTLTRDREDSLEATFWKREENIVKLVRTEQRMLAQIQRINSNCEEFSNEKELSEKQRLK